MKQALTEINPLLSTTKQPTLAAYEQATASITRISSNEYQDIVKRVKALNSPNWDVEWFFKDFDLTQKHHNNNNEPFGLNFRSRIFTRIDQLENPADYE